MSSELSFILALSLCFEQLASQDPISDGAQRDAMLAENQLTLQGTPCLNNLGGGSLYPEAALCFLALTKAEML